MPRTGRTRSLTPEQVDEIHRLRDQGLSWNQIARATGITRSTVIRYANRDPDPDPRTAWDLDVQPVGPAEHQLAKQALGLRLVDDTYVLSRGADPFYCGMDAQVRDGRWFGRLWQRLKMPRGGHSRGLHYKADAVKAPKPDGTVYVNNDPNWNYLRDAAGPARILGYLDPEAVADKRSRGVSVNVAARLSPDDTRLGAAGG